MPPSPPRNTYAFPVYVDSKEFLTRLVHCASDNIVNSSTTRSFFQPSSYIRVDLLLYDSKPTETRGQYNCMPEKIGRVVVPGIVLQPDRAALKFNEAAAADLTLLLPSKLSMAFPSYSGRFAVVR